LFDLLKLPEPTSEPEPNLQAVNQMLAAAAVIPEPVEPELPPAKSPPMKFVDPGEHPQDYDETLVPEPAPEKSLLEQHPYLTTGFAHFKNLEPMVYKPELERMNDRSAVAPDDDELADEHPSVKAAMIKWKEANPGATLKDQRARLARGEISELPWMQFVVNMDAGFGPVMPTASKKGDTWVLTSVLPNKVYKHNGAKWISVDKSHTANYTYNEAYLDHLISKIDSGEYDIDLLSANEHEQIAQRLQKKAT
jgi:hypothetical protein